MELILCIMIGVVFSVAMYLILHRHFFKLILGLMLFGLATNLFIFVVGRLTRGGSPIIGENDEVAVAPFADPVPQALLLTAIVIGFGIQAFALVLIKRVNQAFGSIDMDDMNSTDQIHKTDPVDTKEKPAA